MKEIYDLIGVGVGPFNLSLAALLAPLKKKKVKFLDNKKEFSWHDELMFGDAQMQTSYLKDLVTPVDPTNPYSFLNYLVKHELFYHFLNTDRKTVSRIEFNHYCKWVASNLHETLEFNSEVVDVEFKDSNFEIYLKNGHYISQNLCVASGPLKNIPECAQGHLSSNVFHAKSPEIRTQDFTNKNVLIVGGGQTGVELFRNALNGKWGRPQKVSLVTGRESLRPLDEGPFTNELFTPEFVSNFYSLPQNRKDDFTQKLLLASDGNTPEYLNELYAELYLEKFYQNTKPDFEIMPMRWMVELDNHGNSYRVQLKNFMDQSSEVVHADKIILATGFKGGLPHFLNGLKDKFEFDDQGRHVIDKDYQLKTKFDNNKIFVMNFSRHGHGIADPQTSLMSWRSAVIANQILEENHFTTQASRSGIVSFYKSKE